MFRVTSTAICLACLTVAGAPAAHASVFTDDLSRCLVNKTSAGDKLALVRWIFTAMAASNAVKDMAKVGDQQREMLSRQTAEIFTRLITKDCRTEAAAAIKNDGPEAIKNSFGSLGEIAMTGMMSDPDVERSMGAVDKYFDEKALRDFGREIKLSTQPKI